MHTQRIMLIIGKLIIARFNHPLEKISRSDNRRKRTKAINEWAYIVALFSTGRCADYLSTRYLVYGSIIIDKSLMCIFAQVDLCHAAVISLD